LKCYFLTVDDRHNADVACDVDVSGYFSENGSPAPGFQWQDSLSVNDVVQRVELTFQVGKQCDGSSVTGWLNGRSGVNFNSAQFCSCDVPADVAKTLALPGSAYFLDALNTFAFSGSSNDVGFSNLQSTRAEGNWAQVCVYGGMSQALCYVFNKSVFVCF
jgi:hypothetical protein